MYDMQNNLFYKTKLNIELNSYPITIVRITNWLCQDVIPPSREDFTPNVLELIVIYGSVYAPPLAT